MSSSKYTLDRFEGDFAVFLKQPMEKENLLIHCSQLYENVQEGDIVRIFNLNEGYKIELLEKETRKQIDKVKQLLDQLKNK